MAFIVGLAPPIVSTADVVGPGSSTDNAIARFSGTSGKLLQNSSVIVDDSGNMTGVASLTVTTLIASTTITTGDNIIVLNDDVVGAPTEDAGIEVTRGTSTNAQTLWNETSNLWTAGVVGSLLPIARVSEAVTDNALARYNATTDQLQNSGVILDDSDNVTGIEDLTTTTTGNISSPGAGSNSEKFGATSLASGSNSIAIGFNATAAGTNCAAFGTNANSPSTDSTSVGVGAWGSGTRATSIGKSATGGFGSVSIGWVAQSAANAISIGHSAAGSATDAISIGYNSDATAAPSLAIGALAQAIAVDAIAIGKSAAASSTQSMAIGNDSVASNTDTVAVGDTATASGQNSTAIGSGATTTSAQSVAIGQSASCATNNQNVAIGRGAASSGLGAIAIGRSAGATNSYAISIGQNTSHARVAGIGIGASAVVMANNQLVIGSVTAPITTAYIGAGVSSISPANFLLGTSGGSGTDNAGADFTIAAGPGTGTGLGGSLLFQTAVAAGGTGSTLNTLATRFEITQAGAMGFFGSTPVAQSATYTPTNVVTDRAYDANATSTAELADVLGTLIADLKALGLIG